MGEIIIIIQNTFNQPFLIGTHSFHLLSKLGTLKHMIEK